MKFRRGERKRRGASLDLTPLIDVVFQLVLFFMLSSTFVVQSSIQIEMPEAEGGQAFEEKDLSVTITHGVGGPDNEGEVYVNSVPVESWAELSRKLAVAHTERKELVLLIRPDARVPTERLVRVLGIASSVGIERYGIAAQPPEGSSPLPPPEASAPAQPQEGGAAEGAATPESAPAPATDNAAPAPSGNAAAPASGG